MKYFIDTNIIIDFLNQDKNATQKLIGLASTEGTELFISRLVLTEALRTIPLENKKIFRNALETLQLFGLVEIKHDIYETAIALSRFAKSKGISLKGRCEVIDFINFVVAKHYSLEIITKDADFQKLETLYPAFLSL